MKVMIVVTHLLGTGHLRRALVLAQAFSARGHEVLLASGGMPVPELDFTDITHLQLAPLRSDGVDFGRLLDADGVLASDAVKTARRHVLCETLAGFSPDILITELFPFGRRNLKEEFNALLETAWGLSPRPVILSSVRDILAPPSSAAKASRTKDIITTRYDGVLVHSDPQATTLEQSWPVDAELARRLHYTGYVAQPAAGPHPDRTGDGEILVSAGGGNVATRLFDCAIEAARLMPGTRWRLLVGGNDTDRINALRRRAGDSSVVIEPTRPDFRQMLFHAAASVSLCGYNTALDVLQAGTPAVFVPFDEGTEVEQTRRAESLSHLPGIMSLSSADATPQNLAEAVSALMTSPRREGSTLRFDGAVQSVAIASVMARARA